MYSQSFRASSTSVAWAKEAARIAELQAKAHALNSYSWSSVTLLKAVASQFLWFSSNPGISKENPSHQFTVQKCLLPANNTLPNNYEESYAVIKPFLANTFFYACLYVCVLFRDTDS